MTSNCAWRQPKPRANLDDQQGSADRLATRCARHIKIHLWMDWDWAFEVRASRPPTNYYGLRRVDHAGLGRSPGRDTIFLLKNTGESPCMNARQLMASSVAVNVDESTFPPSTYLLILNIASLACSIMGSHSVSGSVIPCSRQAAYKPLTEVTIAMSARTISFSIRTTARRPSPTRRMKSDTDRHLALAKNMII